MMSNIQILYLVTGHTVVANVQPATIKSALVGGSEVPDHASVSLNRPVRIEVMQHPQTGEPMTISQPFGGLLSTQDSHEDFIIPKSAIVCQRDATEEVSRGYLKATSSIAIAH